MQLQQAEKFKYEKKGEFLKMETKSMNTHFKKACNKLQIL